MPSANPMANCCAMRSVRMKMPHWCLEPLVQAAAADRLGCCDLQVVLYCDLHGHSRKHGAFMYGCEQSPAPQVSPLLLAE